jgi:uncharacterized protein (DUF885 family)
VLARAEMVIERVPVYVEAGAPGGYYQSAALDGSRPGTYFINLRDTAEWPKFTLPTLTYHEGVPGHHWQGSIQQESGSIPFIRSALLSFGAYSEGWASTQNSLRMNLASTPTTRSAASAICSRRRSERRAWLSIPACTRSGGRANKRSSR